MAKHRRMYNHQTFRVNFSSLYGGDKELWIDYLLLVNKLFSSMNEVSLSTFVHYELYISFSNLNQ